MAAVVVPFHPFTPANVYIAAELPACRCSAGHAARAGSCIAEVRPLERLLQKSAPPRRIDRAGIFAGIEYRKGSRRVRRGLAHLLQRSQPLIKIRENIQQHRGLWIEVQIMQNAHDRFGPSFCSPDHLRVWRE